MSTSKRIISLLLALVMVLGMLPWDALGVEAAGLVETVRLSIESAKASGANPSAMAENNSNPTETTVPGNEAEVTRAQWLQMLVETFSMTVENEVYPDNYFTDLSADSEYYYDMLLAVEFGVVDIPAGGELRPDEPATREFAATTLNYCLGFQPDPEITLTFSESATVAAPYDIQIAINRGWFALVDGAFLPEQPITSTEAENMTADAAAVLIEAEIDEDFESIYSYTADVVEVPEGTHVEAIEDSIVIYNNPVSIASGDVFVVYFEGIPCIYQAETVKNTATQTVLTVSTVDESLYYATMEAQGTVDAKFTDFVPEDGTEIIYIDEDTGEEYTDPVVAEQAIAKRLQGISTHASGEIKINRTIKVKVGLEKYGVSGYVEAEIKNPRIKYNISLSQKKVALELTGKTDINYGIEADLMEALKLNEIDLGFIGIKGVGGLKISLALEAKASLYGSISGELRKGLEFSGGSFRMSKSFKKDSFSLVAEFSGKVGIIFKLGINDIPADALEGYVYTEIGAKGEVTHKKISESTCTHVAFYIYFEAGYKASVKLGFFKKSWEDTYDIWDDSNSPVRAVHHYDNGVLVPGCTLGGGSDTNNGYYTPTESPYWGSNWSGGDNSTGYNSAGEPVVTYDYSLDDDGNATITSYIGNATSLTIPQTIDGYPIIAIGSNAFKNKTSLRTVVMQDNILNIGSSAFYGCNNLRNLILSENLTTIGSSAFRKCSSLLVVDIPDSVTAIQPAAFGECTSLSVVSLSSNLTTLGSSAFHNCDNLTSITLPKTIENIPSTQIYDYPSMTYGAVFAECDNLKNVYFEDGTITIHQIMNRCNSIESIAVPATVTEIGYKAFQNCTSLKTVDIPDSVVSIQSAAFGGCTKLTDVVLPPNLTTLGSSAFHNCDGLTEITLPKTITNIPSTQVYDYPNMTYGAVFAECDNLKNVYFEDGTITIHQIMNRCNSIESITVPATVTEIGYKAFQNCTSLKTVDIPDSVVSIQSAAFGGCIELTDVVLPSNLTTLGSSAFHNCDGLTEITLPKTITNIPSTQVYDYPNMTYGRVFAKCDNLRTVEFEAGTHTIYRILNSCPSVENIIIPNSVTKIENSAFGACTNLKEMEIPSTITSIGNDAFNGCSALKEIVIPKTVTSIGTSIFSNCTSLERAVIHDSITVVPDSTFANCVSLVEVSLPDTMTSIKTNAFKNCDSLIAFVIPKKVSTIGNNCFYDCDALTSITIPYGVTAIGSSAFYNCDTLETVDMANSVTSLGSSAFKHCDVLKNVKLSRNLTSIPSEAFRECAELEEIVIPYFTTKIEANAFNSSPKLTKVVVHEKLASINTSAFSYADRTVFYGPTGSYTNTWCTDNGYSFVENTAVTTKATAAESSVTIPKGKTYMLDFDIDPIDFHEIITTKSSNTAVATVDEAGKITALAPGTATIKIIVGGASASCKVTVTQAVTKITLSKTKLSLDVPQTYQLTATITPSDASNKTLNWTSSNPAAATVDANGLVTAVGNGTAVIKAESTDGTGISASCTVTVIDPSKIPVSSITLDKTALSLEAMETYQLTASVSPANAANKALIWTSSDEAVATVDSKGQVTAVAKGTATITATAADGYGASASCTVTVTNNGYVVTALDQFQSSHPYANSCTDFWLYTQPGAGSVSITFDAETEMEDGFDYLYIYDGEGNLIGKYTGTELAGQTITITGDTVKVQIESDDSGNAWGFRVTDIGFTDHTHSFTNYVSDGNATCTEDGTKTAKCDHCDATNTIPDFGSALGHDMGRWETTVPANCTEDGEEQRTCSRCDHSESRVIEAVGHRWDKGVVTREPTEDTEGERLYTCTSCGATRTESIPVIGHEHRYEAVVTAPTCTERGYTTYICKCGESYVADYVAALGHSFGDWAVIQEPTTTEDGLEERSCTRCGYTEQRSTAKLENPFSDVAPGSFYYEPVMWAIENGITNGTSATTFSPGDQCMRAHVVTFLWRAVGSPEPTRTDNPFVDVPENAFYYKPVLWAVENGITSGMDTTHFGPSSYCNRAQVVTFLYRTMGSPELESAENPFTDVAKGSFYEKPVLWAVKNGITNGTSATTFGPGSICNRAQIVTFLYRAFVND